MTDEPSKPQDDEPEDAMPDGADDVPAPPDDDDDQKEDDE